MPRSGLFALLMVSILLICTSCAKSDEDSTNDIQQNESNEMNLSEYQTVEEDTKILIQLISENPSCRDDCIDIKIKNQSSDIISYGDIYELDVLMNDKWYVVNHIVRDDAVYTWTLISCVLHPSYSNDEKIYLDIWNVSEGHYRFLKTIDDSNGSKVMSLEFDLAE